MEEENLQFTEQLYHFIKDGKGESKDNPSMIFDYIDNDLRSLFSIIDPEEVINCIFNNYKNQINRRISVEKIYSILFQSMKNQHNINIMINILEYFQTLIDDAPYFDTKKNTDFLYPADNLEEYFHESNSSKKANEQIKDISMKIGKNENFEINMRPIEAVNEEEYEKKQKEEKESTKKMEKYVRKISLDFMMKPNFQSKISETKENQILKKYPQLKNLDLKKTDNINKKFFSLFEEIDNELNLKKNKLIHQKIIRHNNLFQNYYSMINNKIFFQKYEFDNINKSSLNEIKIPKIPRKKDIDVSFFISILLIYSSAPETRKIKILYDFLKKGIHLIENDDKDSIGIDINSKSGKVNLYGLNVRYLHEPKENIRNLIYKNLRFNDDVIYEMNFDEIKALYDREFIQRNKNKYSNNDKYVKLLYNKNRHYFFYLKKNIKKHSHDDIKSLKDEKNNNNDQNHICNGEEKKKALSIKNEKRYQHEYYLFNLENYLKKYLNRNSDYNSLHIIDNNYLHTFLRNFTITHLFLTEFIFSDILFKNNQNELNHSNLHTQQGITQGPNSQKPDELEIPNRFHMNEQDRHSEYKNVKYTGDDDNITLSDKPVFNSFYLKNSDTWSYLNPDLLMFKKLLMFVSETKGQIVDFSNYIMFNTIFKETEQKTVRMKQFLENFEINSLENQPGEGRKNFSKIFHLNFGKNNDMKIMPVNLFDSNSIRKNFINYLKSNEKVNVFISHMPRYYHYYYNISQGEHKQRNLIDYPRLINVNVLKDHKKYSEIFSQKKIYIGSVKERTIEDYENELENSIKRIKENIIEEYRNLFSKKSSIMKSYYLQLLTKNSKNLLYESTNRDKRSIKNAFENISLKDHNLKDNDPLNPMNKENDLNKLGRNSYNKASDSEGENYMRNAASISIGRNQSIGDTYNSYGNYQNFGGIIEKRNTDDEKEENKNEENSIILEYDEKNQRENISISNIDDYLNNNKENKEEFSEIVDTNFARKDIKRKNKEDKEIIKINNENDNENNLNNLDSISNSIKERDIQSKYISEKSDKNKDKDKEREILERKKREKMVKLAEKILEKNKIADSDEEEEDEEIYINNKQYLDKEKFNFKIKTEIQDAENISDLNLNKNINNNNNNNIEEINLLLEKKRKKSKSKNKINDINNNKIKITESRSKHSNALNINDEENKIFQLDDLRTETKSSKTKQEQETDENNNFLNQLKNSDYDLNILKMDDEMSEINKNEENNLTIMSNPYFSNDLNANDLDQLQLEGRKSHISNMSDFSNLMRNNTENNYDINNNNLTGRSNYNNNYNTKEILINEKIKSEKNSNNNFSDREKISNNPSLNSMGVRNKQKYFDLSKIKENYEKITNKYFTNFGKMGKENIFEEVKFELVDLNLKVNPKVLKFDPKILQKDKKISELAYAINNFDSDKLIDMDERKNFEENLINVYLRLMNEYNRFLYEGKLVRKRFVVFDINFFSGLQECYSDDEFQQIYLKYKHMLVTKDNKLVLDNRDENGKNCILIVPILLEIEKRKILFLAEFNPDGNLIFYDSDEIICGEENIKQNYFDILKNFFNFLIKKGIAEPKYSKWDLKVDSNLTCYFEKSEIILMLHFLDLLIKNEELEVKNLDDEKEENLWKHTIFIRMAKYYKILFNEIGKLLKEDI